MEMNIQDELRTWEHYFELVKKDKELSGEQKTLILEGWRKLRHILGEDLFKKDVKPHPLFERLVNQALWQRLWLADIGERLYELQEVENFEPLRKRFLNPKNFASAEAEFWIGLILKIAGLPFKFIDSRGNKKKADIAVRIANEEVFIEVTTIMTAQEIRKASQTFDAFSYPFLFNDKVIVSGKLYKPLAAVRIRELKKRIGEWIQKVEADRQCREISQEGVIDCFIGLREKQDELQEWQKRKNVSGLWEGPSWDVDEIKRIKGKIAQEINQIPVGEPGIIVIYNNALIFQHHEPNFFGKIVYELEDTVYEYDNLLGVAVIVAQWSPHDVQIHDEDERGILSRKTHNCIERSTFILKNKYCDMKINENAGILWQALSRGEN